jgi:hypothetical protein
MTNCIWQRGGCFREEFRTDLLKANDAMSRPLTRLNVHYELSKTKDHLMSRLSQLLDFQIIAC